MEYTEWEPFYLKIVKDLHLNVNDDKKSARFLDEILEKKDRSSVKKIGEKIEANEVIVFGAGPSLLKSLRTSSKKIDDMVKIAADGATTALLENNIKPDFIVTDLDGKIVDQIEANKNNSVAIIHAHGDNIDKIRKHLPFFKGEILGTTQTNPLLYANLYNFGGFTDGDRAVFLADHFNAKKIFLTGFDFNKKIGEYSFPQNKNLKIKIKKLQWCKKLLYELKAQNG